MLLTNNFVHITDTFFIWYVLGAIIFYILLIYIRSNNSPSNSKLFYSNNKINPGNPEIDPDDSDDNILKKIKKHLEKYKMEYIIGGSILSFIFFICYYYNISIEDITSYFTSDDSYSSDSEDEGSEGLSSESQNNLNFGDIDVDETLKLLDSKMAEDHTPFDILDNQIEEENELVRLRPDLEEEFESQDSQSYENMTMDDFEDMDIDAAIDFLDQEIAEENELARLKSRMERDLDNAIAEEIDIAMAREAAMAEENELVRLRAELEEALMERSRREANASMKNITDQLWGKDKGPFI